MKKRIIALAILLMLIPIQASAATPKVTSFKVSATSPTTARLSWGKVKNVQGYAIYRHGKMLKRVTYKTAAYNDAGLKQGTKYSYTVRAYRTYRQKQYYNTSSKKWQASRPAYSKWKGRKTRYVTAYSYSSPSATRVITTPYVTPPQVTGVKVSATNNSATVTWTKNKARTTHYIVYRNGSAIKWLGKDVSSYKDTSVKASTTYNYQVRAYNYAYKKGYYGAYSAKVNATTKTPAFTLTAKNTADTVSLSWTKVGNYFEIYRNGKYVDGSGKTTFTEKVKPGTYTYYILRFEGAKSFKSNTVTYTVPENKTADNKTNNKTNTVTASNKTNNTTADTKKDSVKTNTNNNTADTKTNNKTNTTNNAVNNTSSDANKSTTKTDTKVTNIVNAITKKSFDEVKTVTFKYGSAEIHLGQEWSSTLKSKLAAGSSGMVSFTRKNAKISANLDKHYDVTLYLFDIGDYDKFAAIYVADNKIIEWVTNCDSFGKSGNTNFARGSSNIPEYGMAFMKKNNRGIEMGGMSLGHSLALDYVRYYRNDANEKQIGLHFINAYRATRNSAPLKYSETLDGGKKTWSGTVEDYDRATAKWHDVELKNVRYGAQAMAETCKESGTLNHDSKKLTKGPLAGISIAMRQGVLENFVDFIDYGENLGAGGVGESCLGVYDGSWGHMRAIVYSGHKYIGIGFAGSNHCEIYTD